MHCFLDSKVGTKMQAFTQQPACNQAGTACNGVMPENVLWLACFNASRRTLRIATLPSSLSFDTVFVISFLRSCADAHGDAEQGCIELPCT